MLRSSLCDYSGACILVKGNISVNNTTADGAAANNTEKCQLTIKHLEVYGNIVKKCQL